MPGPVWGLPGPPCGCAPAGLSTCCSCECPALCGVCQAHPVGVPWRASPHVAHVNVSSQSNSFLASCTCSISSSLVLTLKLLNPFHVRRALTHGTGVDVYRSGPSGPRGCCEIYTSGGRIASAASCLGGSIISLPTSFIYPPSLFLLFALNQETVKEARDAREKFVRLLSKCAYKVKTEEKTGAIVKSLGVFHFSAVLD